ncbi:MAG: ice-binding family protein [Betaproteobacteria bacterium]|jgi:hypothetical protein
MNRMQNLFKPLRTLLTALLMAAFVSGCGSGGGGGSDPGPAGPSPSLGAAATYGIFVGNDAALNLAVNALVVGNVGLMNGLGTCVNCTGLTVTRAIENGTPAAIAAKAALEAAYTDASIRATNACTLANASQLANAQGACVGLTPGTPGPIYGPGLYRSANPIGFAGTITLDAGGNSNAVFIFRTDAAITTQPNSTVILANGAQARNVWWIAGSAATLGLSSTFKGTVVATADVTVGVGSTVGAPTRVNGRVFSRTAAATVGAFTTVTVP